MSLKATPLTSRFNIMSELLHIDGKPFVVVPIHEYRRLMNGGKEPVTDLPSEIMDQILVGQDHPVKIIRRFRGLTQLELAATAEISRPYLTEIETRRKQGSIAALKALAAALNVDIGVLI
jgi:DNA-binding XRE family transcriptional regulator